MTEGVLADRIKSSPELSALHDDIAKELAFHSAGSVQFDPITIIMIISIMVQVVIHCRNKRSDEQIAQDIRDIRTLPPRHLMRLRRRLNRLWRERCGGHDAAPTAVNPLITALYEVSERADDETINELLKLAREQANG
jgi:hypothetical protein